MAEPEIRFTALYVDLYPRVYAYAVTRGGRDIADEVVSETFLVAWRRLGDLPGEPLPWLLGVARNIIRERYRDADRQRTLAAELAAWVREVDHVGDVADVVTERAAVLTALARLPDADRELLTLVSWHDLSTRAAAKVVGCSPAAYFVRLHRARRRLARELAVVSAMPFPTPGSVARTGDRRPVTPRPVTPRAVTARAVTARKDPLP